MKVCPTHFLCQGHEIYTNMQAHSEVTLRKSLIANSAFFGIGPEAKDWVKFLLTNYPLEIDLMAV